MLPTQEDSSLNSTPYPSHLLRRKPWYDFTRHNGYQALAKQLRLQVVSNIDTAGYLWEMFSTNQSIFDLWEVRRSFYESFRIDPYFLVLYEQKYDKQNILGVLPLWLDGDYWKDEYSWYGGFWPEDNIFFVKDLEIIPLLLMASPAPLELQCIKPLPDYEFLRSFPGFGDNDQKFFLNLSAFNKPEEYLMSIKKKKRHNIRRDCHRISDLQPVIELGKFDQLSRLFKLNIERFKDMPPDDKSIFENKDEQALFHYLVKHVQTLEPYIMTISIHGEVEAVEVGFIYDNVCYAFSSGANISKYSGLGVFSNYKLIEEMMKRNLQKIDFLQGDYNWKSSWQLESYMSYEFRKKHMSIQSAGKNSVIQTTDTR
ncbi:MAG: GNAT family N-acetyltransferase [Candidatus Roizmanbacteria bacterium]|nr:GNAT family N-acetyltransferase [Candidatus Roizmanbacteria bacterium]